MRSSEQQAASISGKSVKGVWQLVVRATRSDRFGMLHSWALLVKPQEAVLPGEIQAETPTEIPNDVPRRTSVSSPTPEKTQTSASTYTRSTTGGMLSEGFTPNQADRPQNPERLETKPTPEEIARYKQWLAQQKQNKLEEKRKEYDKSKSYREGKKSSNEKNKSESKEKSK